MKYLQVAINAFEFSWFLLQSRIGHLRSSVWLLSLSLHFFAFRQLFSRSESVTVNSHVLDFVRMSVWSWIATLHMTKNKCTISSQKDFSESNSGHIDCFISWNSWSKQGDRIWNFVQGKCWLQIWRWRTHNWKMAQRSCWWLLKAFKVGYVLCSWLISGVWMLVIQECK